MIYCYTCSELPHIDSVYSVIRRTVWEIADPYHILIFIKSGQCQIEMENRVYRLQAGDVLYIPANTQYTRTPLNNEFCEIYYIHFLLRAACTEYEDADALARALLAQETAVTFSEKSCAFLLPTKSSFKTEAEADAVFRKVAAIKKSYNGDGAFDTQEATFLFCALLSLVSNRFMSYVLTKRADKELNSYPDALKKALAYIRNHYTEKISLDDLCRVSFVSKQMLICYFNKTFSKSPTVYIIEYKISRIKPMLTRYPNMSVKEICGEFGFEDQCYFSRIFKKYTGESPTEYRERVKNFSEAKHIAGK